MMDTSKTNSCEDVGAETVQGEEDRDLKKEVDRLNLALASEKAKSERYLNQLKYMQAEIENIQKRVRRETDEIIKRANERLISNLLTILDDMEMALKLSHGTHDCEDLRSGLELIMKKIMNILEDEGLIRIEAVGKPFNPEIHEAADQVLKEDVPEGIIVNEIRAGYIFKGKLLRPSVVVVSKKFN
ncbi:MAG: nucleotide exchange factor GrpE [Candidatus Bathyarchaeia archaeon]